MKNEPSGKLSPLTILTVLFVGLFLLANIAATKLFSIPVGSAHLIFDGGAVLLPLTYVIGDVLTEVFGFAKTRSAVLLGLAMSAVAAGTFWLVDLLPAAADYPYAEAFSHILGFVPRIVAASLCAFLVGQLLNSLVLVKLKSKRESGRLWVRLLTSSVISEAADTLTFCTVAFLGVLVGGEFWNYVVVGYLYKLIVEVVFLPLAYPLIRWAKNSNAGGSPQEENKE